MWLLGRQRAWEVHRLWTARVSIDHNTREYFSLIKHPGQREPQHHQWSIIHHHHQLIQFIHSSVLLPAIATLPDKSIQLRCFVLGIKSGQLDIATAPTIRRVLLAAVLCAEATGRHETRGQDEGHSEDPEHDRREPSPDRPDREAETEEGSKPRHERGVDRMGRQFVVVHDLDTFSDRDPAFVWTERIMTGRGDRESA